MHQLAGCLASGSRRELAKAITLVESTRAEHRAQAEALLQALGPATGDSLRVGVSGAPGVGKSTFIEVLGRRVIEKGHKLAVLAVDPSSRLAGGSILGDKTRMPYLAHHDSAFVRPSPAGATLGGVARRSRESMRLCEAAGYDVVFVETVGVGQSEVAVADMTDLFVLLLSPGAGDDLQGIKRGIMELTDIIVVNKCDGELSSAAMRTATDCRNALRIMRPRSAGWTPRVLTCSALEGTGIDEVWDAVCAFESYSKSSGLFVERRADQALDWFWSETHELLTTHLRRNPSVNAMLPALQRAISTGEMSPTMAARQVVSVFRNTKAHDTTESEQ